MKRIWRICLKCLRQTCLLEYNVRAICVYCGGKTIAQYSNKEEGE